MCLANSHHQEYKNITLETPLVSPPVILLSLLRFQMGRTSFTFKIHIKWFITFTCVRLFDYNILTFLFLSVFSVAILDTHTHMYEYIPTTPSPFRVVHINMFLRLTIWDWITDWGLIRGADWFSLCLSSH